MLKDWLGKIRPFILERQLAREEVAFPPFRTTIFLFWIMALFGLAYGHILTPAPQGQTVSLTLTLAAWLGVVVIVLLENPRPRLAFLIWQVASLVLVLGFLVIMVITYSLLFLGQGKVLPSIQFAWVGSALVLSYITWRSLLHTLEKWRQLGSLPYPGFLSAPILFLLLVVNYLWWQLKP